jgi:hypothetical protein
MIVQHRAILDASDRKQPWAENCLVMGLMDQPGDLPKSDTICYDVAFTDQCGRGLKPAKIANNAILKMMGK